MPFPVIGNVFGSCWGLTEHTFSEVALSSCNCGCKVYACAYCKKRQVLHNAMYGCRKQQREGEVS